MTDTPQSGLTDNAAGAIAYITFIPAIIFLAIPPYNTSPFVRFHAWQSIFLEYRGVRGRNRICYIRGGCGGILAMGPLRIGAHGRAAD